MDTTDWNPKDVFSSLQGQRYDCYLSLCAAPVGVERFAAAEVKFGKFTLRNKKIRGALNLPMVNRQPTPSSSHTVLNGNGAPSSHAVSDYGKDRSHLTNILKGRPSETVLTNKFESQMTVTKLQCLRQGEWLNDEVINFVMKLIIEDSSCEGRTKIHCFNTFFMERLLVTDRGYRFANVATWTRRAGNVQNLDVVLFPVNVNGNHWTLVVASIYDKTLRYLDSLSGDGTTYLDAVEKWFGDEANARGLSQLSWSRPNVVCPQQHNSFDCGMFVVLVAIHTYRKLDLSYSQADMAECRLKLGMDILNGRLHYLVQPRLIPINRATSNVDGSFKLARRTKKPVRQPEIPLAVEKAPSEVAKRMIYVAPPTSWHSGSKLWPDPSL